MMWFKTYTYIYLRVKAISSPWLGIMLLNTTFNNISVISWRLVLLVEETGAFRENHTPATSH